MANIGSESYRATKWLAKELSALNHYLDHFAKIRALSYTDLMHLDAWQ